MPRSPQDVHKKLLGAYGEKQVVAFLKKQKMKVLEKNYHTPFGEADIIAQEGEEIVFIEVKTRESSAFGEPREAVTPKKQETYRKIALYYGSKHGGEPNARFDVAEVLGKEINYIKNAF
ncbi:MAG: YraN family protein [Clostridia bacterium]|nr:YraN family protein [Clostridia bacterium]